MITRSPLFHFKHNNIHPAGAPSYRPRRKNGLSPLTASMAPWETTIFPKSTVYGMVWHSSRGFSRAVLFYLYQCCEILDLMTNHILDISRKMTLLDINLLRPHLRTPQLCRLQVKSRCRSPRISETGKILPWNPMIYSTAVSDLPFIFLPCLKSGCSFECKRSALHERQTPTDQYRTTKNLLARSLITEICSHA